MVRCPTKVELERYLEGACDAEESRRIETHQGDCPECERWLQAARDDEALYGDVRRLLQDSPNTAHETLVAAEPPSISRYKVLRRLGAGGMGVVYEAEQRKPQRRVALKLLKPGFVTPRALARFEHEAQVLGRLEHPGIARILEADTVEVHGALQPFFAMELVEGRPLDEFARGVELTEKLRLFVKICEAVQHAHQKGVVHRDLKPANVLVTAGGEPRILDFGVARTVDDEELRATLRSQAGEILGTLPYMSPEQVSGRPEEVDTRTDVYALGVVLYELYSGAPPFPMKDISIAEGARIITEKEPPRLADRDLATIAAKALAKEKDRRYPTAAALADDVRRFLEHRPIEARPTGALYQFMKYARRNPAVVAGFGLAIVSLIVGIAATSLQTRRARAAEALAERNAEEARAEAATEQAANQFIYELLGSQGGTRPENYTVLQALSEAERRIAAREIEDPRVEATIRTALGSTQGNLDKFEEAEENLLVAIELREETYGERHPRTAGALNALAVVYAEADRDDEALELFHLVLDIYGEKEQGSSPEAATTLMNIGYVHKDRGELEEAEGFLRQAVAIQRAYIEEYPHHLAFDLWALSFVLQRLGRSEEAEACILESIAIYDDELLGHLTEGRMHSNYGGFLYETGRVEEALQQFEKALEIFLEGGIARDHPSFVSLVQDLAALLEELGLAEEAARVRAELR